jgi:hypothetical protein
MGFFLKSCFGISFQKRILQMGINHFGRGQGSMGGDNFLLDYSFE